jgi:hypothetical protein
MAASICRETESGRWGFRQLDGYLADLRLDAGTTWNGNGEGAVRRNRPFRMIVSGAGAGSSAPSDAAAAAAGAAGVGGHVGDRQDSAEFESRRDPPEERCQILIAAAALAVIVQCAF